VKKKKRQLFRSRSVKKSRNFHSKKKRFTGRVQKNPRGFAFLISTELSTPDTYVSAREARHLMNGDLVEYEIKQKGPRSFAIIHKVLERAASQVFGQVFVEPQRHQNRFFLETSSGDSLEVAPSKQLKNGSWVIAEIQQYPTESKRGSAKINHFLGSELTPEFDHLITVSQFGIKETFPETVLNELSDLFVKAKKELQNPSPGRKDLRHLPFVTIDGEDAKDFDDAIYTELNEKTKNLHLFVAIADVSFFVRENTELDKEAQRRSTSIYFPGTCIPMLPEALSNDLCSLNPQTDKLVLVAEIVFNQKGAVQETDFYPGIINTAARLTYTQVHHWFLQETHGIPENALSQLEQSKRLFEILTQNRLERGVLDFQLPECRFELGPGGLPLKAYPFPQWEAHRLIEEFMIMANSSVAQKLTEKGFPSLYRVHEAPLLESIEEINHLMKSLGFSLMLKEVSPLAFAKILSQTKGKKGAHTLHKAILRAQKQARYEPHPKGHFGLALSDYTHFTSPIRRYPDLIGPRSLKNFIQGKQSADKSLETEKLIKLGELTSERERRAMEAERFINRRKQCWFMKDKIGDSFDGLISGVIPKGIFVEIFKHAIEGFIPIESLLDSYVFDEQRACLRRRPGHSTLSIGDNLRIQVTAVSMEDSEITFNLLDISE